MAAPDMTLRAHRARRLGRAIQSVFDKLRQKPVDRRTVPPDLRAECEMLEERRLLNGTTYVGSPPYYSAYTSYNFMYSWEDCCGQSHGIHAEFDSALVSTPTSFMYTAGASVSTWPVRYSDGQPMVSATDIDSDAFGQMWGQTRVWSEAAGSDGDTPVNGNHWTIMQVPHLVSANGDLAVVDDGQSQRWFAPGTGGTYNEVGVQMGDSLRYDSASGDYVVTDNAGNQEWFTAPVSGTAGQMVQYLDSTNHLTKFIYTSGQLTEVQRSSGNDVEDWHYFYLSSGVNAGKLSGVVLRQSTSGTSGPWSDVREADYTYYDGSYSGNMTYGNAGDLQSVTIRVGASSDVTSVPGSGAVLGTTWYRYYTPSDAGSIGYVGGLQYVFNPEAFASAQAAGYDPETSSDDAHLQQYCDDYFEYGNAETPASNQMVVKEIAHDAGCTCTSDNGQATYYYNYLGNASDPNRLANGYDNWVMRTIVNTPDGNAQIVYTNFAAEDLLDAQLDLQPGISISSVSKDSTTGNWKYSGSTYNYTVGESVLVGGIGGSSYIADADDGLFTVTAVGAGYFEVSNGNGQAASGLSGTAQGVNRQFLTAKHYDATGNLLWTANPSAVTGYSESYNDLVNYSATTNTATYVSASSGLIQGNDYYSAGWAISGNAGIASNGSTISGSLAAQDGTQAAYLADTSGSISQTFTTSVSITAINFWAGYASGSGSAPTVEVEVDGGSVHSYTLGTSYTQYSPSVSIGAGTHVITFITTAGTAPAMIDDVTLSGTGAPALSDPSFETPSLVTGTFILDPLGTTASATVAGGVNGLIEDTEVQQGLGGTRVIQQQYAYVGQGGGTSGQTTTSSLTYLPGTITTEGNTAGTDPRTTTYAYQFFGGTTRVQSETITSPPITATQDGPASSDTDTAHADVTTTVYDTYGRVISTIDGGGYVNETQYDTLTGAVSKSTIDTSTPYQDYVLGNAPVGYWRLGESSGTTAVDSSGNGNNGTYSGVTLGASGALSGDSNAAASFGGSGQVSLTASAPLKITGDITLEAWVKTTSTAGYLISCYSASSPWGGYALGFGVAGVSGVPAYWDGGSGWIGATHAINDGNWHHVAVVATSTSIVFYIDGAVDKTVSANGHPVGTGTTFLLGASETGTSPYSGTLDEAAVYNHALGATQVANDYSAGRGTIATESHQNLTTTYAVDGLGRDTEITSPAGNVTCIVYNDASHETRTYVGWNSTTHTATGPIEISREYYPTTSEPTLYTEAITSSATPTYNGTTNLPTGQETINQTNIESLSRNLTNNGGEVVETDNYFSLSGVTYSQATLYLGTSSNNSASGNYSATLYGFDKMGRQNRVQTPSGTIYRTVYDVLGNVSSRWVGTDDTPGPSYSWWSPNNNGGNMTVVEEDAYDNAGAAPAPQVSSTTGTGGPSADYSVRITYVTNGVESPASSAVVYAVALNHVLTVTTPSVSGVDFNVYVSINGQEETLQNSTPLTTGSTWTESTGGITTSGTLVPLSGVGDGNLTEVTSIPGASDQDRITDNLYDSRDRLIATKEGVLAGPVSSEDTTTHRPIYFFGLDNLGEVVGTYQFDGDQVALSDFAGGLGGLSSGDLQRLRAQTLTSYDDQGRVYQTQQFSVDRTTGTASTYALTGKTWYDHRGNVIKTLSPGGLVQKYVYDGAGRQTTAYTTDGGGDSSWSDAGNVTGDIVLSQIETQYDGDGNPVFVTDRERFSTDTSTQTGALGSPSSGVGARVYYTADYYDAADRLIDSADIGTDGGTTLTSAPALGSLPSGTLVTSYGYAGDNVQQVTITGSPTGGTFTLSFGGYTTSNIAYNASASTVQSDLQALTSIGSGNVGVSGPAGGPYLIRFTGSLAGSVQSSITAASSLTGGTSPTATVALMNVGGDAGVQQKVTDPRGIVTKTDIDLLGRTTRTISAFSNGTPTSSTDQTTAYTYDGEGHELTQTAVMPSGGTNQVTQWVYGYAGSGKYTLNSNDVLVKEEMPDPTTGQPSTSSSSDQSYTYDDLGEQMKLVDDENGTIQAYTYDVLGRTTSDSVSLLGSGVDGTVTSLSYAYDTNGQLLTATSNGSSGILNQVEEAYNGLGQLVGEYQSHSGVVTIGSTPEVQYLFQSLSGSTSDGRATGMIYPNARQLDYVYNTGLDSNISRVSALADDSGTGTGNIESYSYLGLGTIVERTRPNNTDLTYVGSSAGPAGDDYTGLDEFGRVIDQNWQTTSSGSAIDRYQYGYDADSNVLYQLNLSSGTNAASYSELFHVNGSSNGYDNLNRLTDFQRGTLNSTHDSITGTAGETQDWTLDALGNWSGANAVKTNGVSQSRSANARNEYTGVGSSTPTYDNNGNLTKDENGQQYVYDAWNRLKQVKNSSGTVLVTYSYDALGRRIVEAVNGGSTTDVYFDTAGNDIEERQSGTTTTQYVWGLGAPDQLVLRDRNADGNSGTGSFGKSGSGLEERFFVQQDANQNVTALVDGNGTVWERFAYDPYGKKYVLDSNWNSTTDGYNWLYGFQGGRQDPTSGLLHFDARDYSTSLGRWTEPDPAGYIQGPNGYQVDVSAPTDRIDPSGLIAYSNGVPNPIGAERVVEQGPGGTAVIWVPVVYKTPPGAMELADTAAADGGGNFVVNHPWLRGWVNLAFAGSGAWGWNAAQQVRQGFQYGSRGGASIAASKLSCGLTDRAGLTNSGQYQGGDFDASRRLAGFSRSVLIMAGTAGAMNFAAGAVGNLTAAGEAGGAAESTANEGIYEFTASSGKTYVGQSGNIAARIDQHLASGKLLSQDLGTVRCTAVSGGRTAREVAEQLRINELGGVQNLENIRNPIGPGRQYLLPNPLSNP